MKAKNLKRKEKRQPGGSLKPDCSAVCGELIMLEYQSREMGKQMQLDSSRMLSLAANIGRMRDMLKQNH